jgi:glutamine synthetase
MQLESRLLSEICLNQILPVSIRYQSELAQNVLSLQDLELSPAHYEAQLDLVKQIASAVNFMKRAIEAMKLERDRAETLGLKDKAFAYQQKVKPYMEEIRQYTDVLEQLVEDEAWPLPKYRELFFLK